LVTLATADMAITPAMHCQRTQMPCCPRSGPNGESCSSVGCTEQIPEKSEAQAVRAKESAAAAFPPAVVDASGRRKPLPARELTSGLRYRAPVFHLKDDFRI
jgi:hypothetical protein